MGRRGQLITNNVHLQDHEYNTVELLLDSGYNIELIPPLKIKGTKTADVVINGVMWEMKAPTGNGKLDISK
ncbi:MAG: hypothetical protein J6Z02_01960 [Lachnospiraceae bacterium]|nr:hypothetical protein [Lachnospiraceae bacterium]